MGADFRLIDLVVLDEPEFRPHVITENFWRGWEKYRRPTLVSFNGRGFDLPLLELAAFRYGVSLPAWFNVGGKSFEQPRNRYNPQSHVDLCELLTNFGSTRFTGGLNLAANLLGKPGKMDVQGDMVQDMYDAGRLAEINDYCRCDVLDTYFVFLRTRVLVGQLSLDAEQTDRRRDQAVARAEGRGDRTPTGSIWITGATGRTRGRRRRLAQTPSDFLECGDESPHAKFAGLPCAAAVRCSSFGGVRSLRPFHSCRTAMRNLAATIRVTYGYEGVLHPLSGP